MSKKHISITVENTVIEAIDKQREMVPRSPYISKILQASLLTAAEAAATTTETETETKGDKDEDGAS
ncbi:hypothetical protein [Nitrososphaera sp. AFS]|uniref:hypothetical protein n=1 Tax=Nitrososphaera sp. AFS TaxID=2301191 RepID=UPI00139233A9|nr:hypothetical protein [Nitrososphaera sp. AFS]NAL78414.1 hypothetical protein [Nitrososphaera sp. AFS]